MTWIQLIDKHPDGFWCLAVLGVVGLVIVGVELAAALSKFGRKI